MATIIGGYLRATPWARPNARDQPICARSRSSQNVLHDGAVPEAAAHDRGIVRCQLKLWDGFKCGTRLPLSGLSVERYLYGVQVVGGSNPLAPTN